MNKQNIAQLKAAFDQILNMAEGTQIEFCYARDLMVTLGYDREGLRPFCRRRKNGQDWISR